MSRKLSHAIAAGLAALSLSTGALADDTFPLSVNESGPVYPQHATAPAQGAIAAAAVGATKGTAAGGGFGSGNYEVRTPASVNESAPWLTGTDRR